MLVYTRVCPWWLEADPSIYEFWNSITSQSLLSEAGIANGLPHSPGIYVDSTGWNSDLHARPTSALRAEPSPQPI